MFLIYYDVVHNNYFYLTNLFSYVLKGFLLFFQIFC